MKTDWLNIDNNFIVPIVVVVFSNCSNCINCTYITKKNLNSQVDDKRYDAKTNDML